MSFFVNEEITTKLHYKDICVIAAALHAYQHDYGHRADPEMLDRMRKLVDRLGVEMYNHPKNDELNSH